MSAFFPSDLSYPYNSLLPNRTPLPWFLRTAFSSLAQCIVFLSIPYLLSTFSTFLVSADNGLPTPPYTCHRDGRLDSLNSGSYATMPAYLVAHTCDLPAEDQDYTKVKSRSSCSAASLNQPKGSTPSRLALSFQVPILSYLSAWPSTGTKTKPFSIQD